MRYFHLLEMRKSYHFHVSEVNSIFAKFIYSKPESYPKYVCPLKFTLPFSIFLIRDSELLMSILVPSLCNDYRLNTISCCRNDFFSLFAGKNVTFDKNLPRFVLMGKVGFCCSIFKIIQYCENLLSAATQMIYF